MVTFVAGMYIYLARCITYAFKNRYIIIKTKYFINYIIYVYIYIHV